MNKSDFEINKVVAENLGKKFLTFVNREVRLRGYKFDPCNNPADAMPIVIKNGISLIFQEGIFQFATYDGNFEVRGDNPYRSAMEVFLMMKDAEK